MAAAPAKGKRKRSLSEDDVYLLLHRYAPATILTMLQEVAQHAEGRRIDWAVVVAKSATGISSAREYQMLWRHFAYHHELDESFGAGEQPLGDDSDLECELEPVPNPSKEALSEASALAKALISGSSREQASSHRVNLDAPMLNLPNEKIVRVPSDKQLAQSHRLTNLTVPVSNCKQVASTGPSPDPFDTNGPSKKKKKPKTWSKEEDADLAAGVQKYGEGNWMNILHNCNFDNTRTPLQLSQRWMVICKRPGGSTKPASAKNMSIASSEEREAANKAFTMAVGPMRGSSTLRSGAQQQSIQHTSAVFAPTIPEVKPVLTPLPVPIPVPVPVAMPVPVPAQVQSSLLQGQQAPAQAAPPKASNALKTRKKQAAQPNPTIGPSSIQAAAIAAGGRIVTTTTGVNFLKVAQSKNAVHIRSRVTGPSKPSTGSKASITVVEHGTQPGGAQHLEPSNTGAHKSGPSNLTTRSTEKVHGVSEVAAVNPSAGTHFLETKKSLSTTPVPASCDSEEKDDDSNFRAVTIDDLFPEDANEPEIVDLKAKQLETADFKVNRTETLDTKAKQQETVDAKVKQSAMLDLKAKQLESVDLKGKQPDPKVEVMIDKDKDMLEFDRYVASQGQGACLNTDYPDKSNTVRNSPGAQGAAGCQKKQLKPSPATVKSGAVFIGASAAMGKIKSSVPLGATSTPTGIVRGIVGNSNSTAPMKTLVRKAAAPAPAGSQAPLPKKQNTNTKGNQIPSKEVVGSGVPASSQASAVVNAGSKANGQASAVVNAGSKANSQASAVVNGGSKANPPSSSQASAVVNAVSKANPPSISQASVVVNACSRTNPPSSSQASAVVNVGSKANPPISRQGSTVVNGASNANPPSSSQATTAVNGGSKANPAASSTVVNGVARKANPPAPSQ